MKKIILGGINLLLFTLAIFLIYKGINSKSLRIASINNIKQAIQNVDNKIFNINILSNSSYPTAKSSLTSKTTNLENVRLKYETKKNTVNTDSIDKYRVEYLWALIGNYASEENVELGLNFTAGAIEDTYNLDFTVTGDYTSIIDFIDYLEDDPELKFEISNFNIFSRIQEDRINKNMQILILIAEFSVKNIYVVFD